MLKSAPAFASFSVSDIPAARRFYGDTLGLDVKEESMEGYPLLGMKLGSGGRVMLYPKPNHAPAGFTVLNFEVPDIEQAVTELEKKGVRFEHYASGPVKTDARGISRSGDHAIAWFKDPSGNVLSVVQQK